MAGRLHGKVALITGAASGIGRATAALFHAEGAKVAATDRNEAGLKALGPDADLILAQDVTDEARWREVVDAVLAAFGRLDILVNSAGIGVLGNIEQATLADWRKVHAVNVEGTFLGCREAVRAMKPTGGGSIVNLSSVAGIIGDASSARLLRKQGRGAPFDQIRRAALRPRRLQDSRQFGPPLVRGDANGARGHRAGEGPRPRTRRPLPRRPDGAHGQGGRGREHDPFPRQRRILVHDRRRVHGRRRTNGAVIGWARFASSAASPPRISFFQAFTGVFSAAPRISVAAGNCEGASSASSGDAALDAIAARAGWVGAKPW